MVTVPCFLSSPKTVEKQSVPQLPLPPENPPPQPAPPHGTQITMTPIWTSHGRPATVGGSEA